MATATCKHCSKEFKRWGKPRFGSAYKFCSRKCYWDSMTVLLTCKTCGKEFKRTSNGVLKYCSKECKLNGEWGKINKTINLGRKVLEETRKKLSEAHKGEKSSFWRGGNSELYKNERYSFMKTFEYKNWLRKVFERDFYTCQMCNKKGSAQLNCHHILPYRDFPEYKLDVNNGVTLCKKCHKMTYRKEWYYAPKFMGV